MKNTKTLPILVLATLLLASCGKLTSERKPFDKSRWGLTLSGQPLSQEAFAATCLAKPGMLIGNNTICRFEAYRNVLSEGSAAINESADQPLTDIPSGSAVETIGYASNNAVQILLNSNYLTGVPTSTAVVTNGGRLGYRLRPGQISGVKVFVYSCVNQSQQAVRCPH